MAKRGHTPRLATYRPIGSPLGRRNFAHWPHTTGCHSLAKRGATLTAPPGRRPFADWPPLATASLTGHLCPPPPPLAREADGTHREKGSHALTGLPLATYWPPTGHPGRPHWPPTGQKGTGGGDFARPSPDWPPTPPPPHQPIEAFGREASPTPRLTDWLKGPPRTGHLRPPTGHPGPPPLPRLSGSGGLRDGEGFSVQRVPIRCAPCALYPLWGPPPPPTPPTDWPPNFPHRLAN